MWYYTEGLKSLYSRRPIFRVQSGKKLHRAENFYTDAVCGVCDKYRVCVQILCKTFSTLIAQEGTHRLSMTFNNWSKCQIKLFKSKLFSVQNATKTYWGCKRYPKNDLVVSPWAKKEPLRARWATEVDHSHQNHRLKKVAPWVCTVGIRVVEGGDKVPISKFGSTGV